MRLAPFARSAFGLSLFAIALLGCPNKDKATPDGSAGPGASGAGAGAAAGSADASADGATASEDDVEPVYPLEPNAKPVPVAQKLCEGLGEMPEKKRAACCNTKPGIVVTAECTRELSAAIRHDAIALADADVDACIAAFEKTLDGCDWVGPFSPGPPPACQGILKGKVAAGKKCRSSLECVEGLRCEGVGPTTPGRCGEPKATGEICGGTVDSLAGYTRQSDLERLHPECKEKCIRHRCAPPATEGKTCQTTADCATGLACVVSGPAPKVGLPPKTCVAGKPPGNEGEPCPGGECATGLSCIRGKCAGRKAAGAECTADFECRGGCVKGDAGDKGQCGPRCDIR